MIQYFLYIHKLCHLSIQEKARKEDDDDKTSIRIIITLYHSSHVRTLLKLQAIYRPTWHNVSFHMIFTVVSLSKFIFLLFCCCHNEGKVTKGDFHKTSLQKRYHRRKSHFLLFSCTFSFLQANTSLSSYFLYVV